MHPFRAFLEKITWDKLPLVPPAPFSPSTHDAFLVVGPDGEMGLFTGYYEPFLRGSFIRDEVFCHPVYAPPPELAQHSPEKPFPHNRAAIAAGALHAQGLEILYVDDAVDLFFMHVQGSGAVRLPDGRVQRLSFAGKTFHPYTAIGKVLKDRGALTPPITMQTLRAWLSAHPSEQQTIFNHNQSHIFFKMIDGTGPVGAAGELLQSEGSLAIDDALYPYGLDVIVETTDPLDNNKPFIRLMRTADKGSAIKGAVRGDIYFGSGEDAGNRAGRMNAKGRMFVLLKK